MHAYHLRNILTFQKNSTLLQTYFRLLVELTVQNIQYKGSRLALRAFWIYINKWSTHSILGWYAWYLLNTYMCLRRGSTIQAHRDQFEANWGKLDAWTEVFSQPYLPKWFFKTRALLWASFLGWNRFCLLPKWCHVGHTWLRLFLVLDSHIKAFCPNYISCLIWMLHLLTPPPLPHL